MAQRLKRSVSGCLLVAGMLVPMLSGCKSAGDWARLRKDNEALQRDKQRLQDTIARRDAVIAALSGQIETLEGFGPDQPAALFAPVKIEIAGLSGGTDYDGQPGDDGVTVYLRPRDANGDVVKVPGRITIQLQDNTDPTSPRLLGGRVFDDPARLGKLWHGKFITQHYTLKCPFSAKTKLPTTRRVTVHAEFVDYLTGATLTAVKEVSISFPDR